MEYVYVLLVLGLVIGLGIFLNRLSFRFKLPALILFIGLGLIFGAIFRLTNIGNFTDYDLGNIVCSIALIFIIFYGGFGTNIKTAKPVLGKSIALSFLGTALTAIITGFGVYLIFRVLPFMEVGLLESFLVGSVIASTDAASVFDILRRRKLNLKYHTASLLEVESGSNDPMAYILTFLFVVLIASEKGLQGFENIGVGSVVLSFFMQLILGIAFGLIFGFGGAWILKRFGNRFKQMSSLFILAIAVLSFAVPQSIPMLYSGNGYLSAYLAGIIIGNTKLNNKKESVIFFDSLTSIAQMLIFFLLGLLATPEWLIQPEVIVPAILIFLVITLISRPLSVFGVLVPFKSKVRQMALVSSCGLRGVASIVFAIFAMSNLGQDNLPYDLFSIVFLVCLFSLIFQGSILPFLSEKLKMISPHDDVMKTFSDYSDETNISFIEMDINKNHPYCDKALKDCVTSKEFLIVLVVRNGTAFVPNGNTVIQENDKLICSAPSFSNAKGVEMEEVDVTRNHPFCKKEIKELSLPKGELIALIKRKENNVVPDGNTKILPGDVLVTIKVNKVN